MLLRDGRVLVIDDFHYLPTETRVVLSRQIKSASEEGLTMILSSVSHRAEEPAHANRDLIGRIEMLNLAEWDPEDLTSIANQGFDALNASVDPQAIALLASESGGSPLLMHQFCKKLCITTGITSRLAERTDISPTREVLSRTLRESAEGLPFSDLFTSLECGPSEGSLREVYAFNDGSTGSLYHAILRTGGLDPMLSSVTDSELTTRIASLCQEGAVPDSRYIHEAALSLSEIARADAKSQRQASEQVLEWRPDTRVLEFPDPYFLHYLRWGRFIRYRVLLMGQGG
jgi:hypothetical protein